MTRITLWSVVAIAIMCSVQVSRAGVLQYSATFDTVSHYFSSDPWFPPSISSMKLESSVGYPTFTGDFQVDKQLRITYSAPAGHQFVFDPPLDADQLGFHVWFSDIDGISSMIGTEALGVSIEFTGSKGTLPTSSSFKFVYGGPVMPGPADNFAALYYGNLAGPFSFESLTALFDVPAAYNQAFVSLNPTVKLGAAAYWSSWSGSVPSDPGVWLTIEPVTPIPAPSAIALVSLGLPVLTAMRRRHRERAGSR